MKVTKRQLHHYIKRMLSERAPLKDPLAYDDPTEVAEEAHSAWAGGNAGEVEDANLVLPIDHAEAVSGEPTVKEPEMLPRQESLVGESRKVTITKKQLRKLVREAILLEEPADYLKDLKAGTITKSEYDELVRQYEMGISRPSTKPLSQRTKRRPAPKKVMKKWRGTQKELYQRVAEYLVDIGFYNPIKGRDGKIYADLIGGSGGHPKGGFTSNIPDVLNAAVESGEIDWATYDEMFPIYRKMDRAID